MGTDSLREKKYLLFLLLLSALFALWKLGAAPLMEWDESRNGVTAIEMQKNKDYLNPHYGGQIEDWSVKPPLFIWTVVGSFKLFGQNAFALRLPSALASILSLYWIFQIIRLYKPARFALLAGLILLSARGFLGPHVGRSGDYDALLLCFLLAGLYYFLRYLHFQFYKGIYWAALAWGLAFWVKGPAAFLFFPGLILYILGRGLLLSQIKNKHLWGGIVLFSGIIGVWVLAIYWYGATFSTGDYEGQNAFQRIFLNDVIARFTDPNFDQSALAKHKDYGFFFSYLDSRFSIWAYVFYSAWLLLLFQIFRVKSSFFCQIQKHPLLLISVCLWMSIGFFLTLASSKHHWYMAPALPFVVITMLYAWERYWQQVKYPFYVLLAITLAWQFYQFSAPPSPPEPILAIQKTLATKSNIYLTHPLPKQDDLLYLHFYADEIFYCNDFSDLENAPSNSYLFIHQSQKVTVEQLPSKWLVKNRIGDHLLLESKLEQKE